MVASSVELRIQIDDRGTDDGVIEIDNRPPQSIVLAGDGSRRDVGGHAGFLSPRRRRVRYDSKQPARFLRRAGGYRQV